MKPVQEIGGEKYLRSKKYYPYVGMGYVQLTWRENYQKASDKLSVDFVSNPKLLLEPVHAAEILVLGIKEGWFAGKRLSDYITLKASDIARIAHEYDCDLKAEVYGEDHIADVRKMVPQPDNPEIDIPTTETKLVPVAKSKRFWTWITAAALPALGLLDWRVQLASVVIVGGIAGWAIYSMPQVKAKLSKLVEAL